MTKREKRLRDLRNKIARYEATREAAIKQLVRTVTELPKLRKEEARLSSSLLRRPVPDASVLKHPVARPADHVAEDRGAPDDAPIPVEDDTSNEVLVDDPNGRGDGFDIPAEFRRTSAGADKDAEARAQIQAEQAAEKKRKDALRIKKLRIAQEIKHAELTGQRRKMPLTGRAALDALK
jgi:hypothetical protein